MRTWRTIVTATFAVVVISASSADAQKGKPPSDLPVATTVFDRDATGTPYTIQSDTLGDYVNGVGGVVSVLMANVFNSLYYGDWQMYTFGSTTRTVRVTLLPTNAIPSGAAGYTIPPNPPFWGTAFEPAKLMVGCTKENKDMATMGPQTTMTCGLLVRVDDPSGESYRLDMGGAPIEAPESTPALVSCNSADLTGCNDWFIDPIPTVNADGSTSSGQSIARLVFLGRKGTINLGDFYMTYHFHIHRS